MDSPPIEQVAVTQEDLEPCPFCEAPASIFAAHLPDMPGYGVEATHAPLCPLAQAQDYVPLRDTEAEAIKAWNTRASVPLPTRPVSDLEYEPCPMCERGSNYCTESTRGCGGTKRVPAVAAAIFNTDTFREEESNPATRLVLALAAARAAISVPLPTLTDGEVALLAEHLRFTTGYELEKIAIRAADALTRQQIQLEELREALSPFAEAAQEYRGSQDDFELQLPRGPFFTKDDYAPSITIGELRRARKALGVSLG